MNMKFRVLITVTTCVVLFTCAHVTLCSKYKGAKLLSREIATAIYDREPSIKQVFKWLPFDFIRNFTIALIYITREHRINRKPFFTFHDPEPEYLDYVLDRFKRQPEVAAQWVHRKDHRGNANFQHKTNWVLISGNLQEHVRCHSDTSSASTMRWTATRVNLRTRPVVRPPKEPQCRSSPLWNSAVKPDTCSIKTKRSYALRKSGIHRSVLAKVRTNFSNLVRLETSQVPMFFELIDSWWN